jgi:hypothetical protein
LGIAVTPTGIINITHLACLSVTVTFVAKLGTDVTEADLNSSPEVKWLTVEEYEALEGHNEEDLNVLKNLPQTYVAPLNVITLEMEPFK